MMVKRFIFTFVVFSMISIGTADTVVPDQSPSPHEAVGAVDSAAQELDTIQPTSGAAMLCTLEVSTEPAAASIALDGNSYGISPVTIDGIATGNHTLIIQKPGYYQKKVTITLSDPKITPLFFQLSAPGRIMISSVPLAGIFINGISKGTTPYIDSLVKPGTYHVRLVKESFNPFEDSVVVRGGDTITRIDTLTISDVYRDSVATCARKAAAKARRFSMELVAGAFGLFLLVILIVEGLER